MPDEVPVKPVKKNTLYRRFRAWEIRLDRRQQQREIIPDTVDTTHRQCCNCGHEYIGRGCPQCGQVGTWERFSWRQAFLNLLDIWGLGNRPMHRTLRELFWRPGYMIRDYLLGHRQFYFPPFKLLAVIAVLLIATSWFTGVEVGSVFGSFKDDSFANDVLSNSKRFSGFFSLLFNAGVRICQFLGKNLIYEWLFLGAVAVIGIWIAFHRYHRYNFVETYICFVFIMAQQLLTDVPIMFGTGLNNYVTAHVATGVMPLVSSMFTVAGDVISSLYNMATLLLVVMTLRQFYGLKWKTTVWRLFISLVTLIAIGLVIITIIVIFYRDDVNVMARTHIMLALMLIPAAFTLANWMLNNYKSSVEPSIITTCKCLMLSVFMIPVGSVKADVYEYGILMSVILVILYGFALVAASLLPIMLYKKTQRTWLAIMVPVAIVALLVYLPFLI